MPNLKIAIVRTSGRPVDAQFYNVQEIGLAKELAKRGWACDIYLASKEAKLRIQSLSPELIVNYWPSRSFLGDQGIFPGLVKHLLDQPYSIVQVQEHWQYSSVVLSRALQKKRVPVILGQGKYKDNPGPRRIQNFITDLIGTPILRRNIACALCKTTAAQRYLQSKGFTKSHVIPIGLDIDKFPEHTPPIGKRSEDFFELLYVGTVRKPRDIPFLIKLVGHIKKERQISIRLTVVGDGPDLEYCKSLADELGISNNIRFVGKVQQEKLSDYYSSSHVFLLPTKAEIYGMVLLESMYFGTPPISTRTAGPNDIITDGIDGFLVQELDLEKWATLIEKMMHDRELHSTIAQNAAKKVRAGLTWNALGDKYDEFYQSMLG